MNNIFRYFVLPVMLILSFKIIMAQALETDPEEGRGTYKNRVFFNLERYWDYDKVCNNPHKGWCIHYYDNGLSRYGIKLAPDDSLPGFPGLNDIYLRLAWAYLEPEEGKYNWAVIDSIITRWISWGHPVSFRITCKETGGPPYSTPKWVEEAGAKGVMRQNGKAWDPDYGDPIFLEKLKKFHKAFAQRYDGKPWVEYIDIGSIGEWGEGHTAYSGWYDVPFEVVKKHIDIYKECYKKTPLIISDDFIGQRDIDDGADYKIFNYCLEKGLGFRDDSGNVKWYRDLGFGPSCIRTPELYSKVYKKIPIVLESEHYASAVRYGMWGDGAGFEQAVRETHATFIGFHYYPHEWLNENYRYAGKLANLCGYWYFPKFAMMPDTFRTKSNYNYIRLTWENKGVAPAYHKYKLSVRLVNKETKVSFEQQLTESDNRTWMPDEIVAEQCTINLDKNLVPGKYDLFINMRDECGFHNRNIELALKKERETESGWYKLGEMMVK